MINFIKKPITIINPYLIRFYLIEKKLEIRLFMEDGIEDLMLNLNNVFFTNK